MGEVFRFGWEVEYEKCGYRASLVGEIVSDVDCYVGAEIPPAGAPAGFDGTP